MNRITAEKLEEGDSFLVLSSASTLKENNIRLVQEVQHLQYRIIMITFNQPSPILKRTYVKNNIDLETIIFIDAVSKYALGTLPEDIDRAVFINNPRNLTNLSVAISEMLKEYSGTKTCVILDSISTMLIYLSSEDISKFAHFMTSKLAILGMPGFFVAVENGLNPVLMTHLSTFTSEVIDFTPPHEG
ncbi:hypothetical protein L1S32_11370 [Methanogenium sp. S4BF]|uniref:hypothetical protein n=1 Tax=Methanogenium sp. S4BF TaxID=1789226 RepID=UPI002416BD57|nr:hypothetical protein [Methanogenium sp. S4BF]WFN34423.1 hypothetical protein L1S32_11370 [Methanogenium sp. S4BF]